jgi:hypothetical protein
LPFKRHLMGLSLSLSGLSLSLSVVIVIVKVLLTENAYKETYHRNCRRKSHANSRYIWCDSGYDKKFWEETRDNEATTFTVCMSLQPLWTFDGGSASSMAATYTRNKRTQTSMLRVGFEPTIPVFGRAKTVHALDGAATMTGNRLHQTNQNARL